MTYPGLDYEVVDETMTTVEQGQAELNAHLAYLNHDERDLVARALALARQAHGEQLRKSGEPYVIHPITVAQELARLRMDAATLAAALLHDVIEDTPITYDEVVAQFGTEVAQLVLGVTKLGAKVREMKLTSAAVGPEQSYEEQEAASLVNLLLAMASDLRVVVIKLYDRLHNMHTIRHLKPEKQERIARETSELFLPLATRLGIWQLKQDLDDLCLEVLEPETYAEIQQMLAARSRLVARDLADAVTHLQRKLNDDGIPANVRAQPDRVAGLHYHIRAHGWDSARTYDGLRVEVVVESRPACYAALGSVHELWSPVPGRVVDYIAAPKENLYRSLHTVVIGLRGHPLEVRIHTDQMRRLGDHGMLLYLQHDTAAAARDASLPELPWLNELSELPDDDPQTFLDLFKSEITPERIRVFTPKGDVKELPVGSTPVDFAYAVHTEIGHHCRKAYVNSQSVPLNTPLQSGDQVEIVKSISPSPDRAWLDEDLGYVANPYTLRHIRRWFSHQPQEEILRQGREIIEKEIDRWGGYDGWAETEEADPDRLARQRGFTAESLSLRVGRGEFSVHELGTFILSEALGDAGDAGPYLVTLEMDATDRPNLLRDACQVVADDNVNLHGAWGRGGQESGLALVHLSLDAPTLDHVVRIAHRLAHMPGTLRVRRTPNDVNPTCTL